MTAPGTILVRPVLFCAPVFWIPDYWSESARVWDSLRPETPLDQKPSAELEVSLDVTLGEVFDAACDAWRIQEGPGLLAHGETRRGEFWRFAFVQPVRDANGVDAQRGYAWPPTLPIARESGIIEQVPALEVTYRELLASSSLGLLEGDVERPYVYPVRPQGDIPAMIEAGRLTAQAIRAAYAHVDDAVGFGQHTINLIRVVVPQLQDHVGEAVDDVIAVGFVVRFSRWLRRHLRTKGGKPADRDPPPDAA